MAPLDKTSLSYLLKIAYGSKYEIAASRERVYEHYCYPIGVGKDWNMHNSSAQQIFMGGMSKSQNTVPTFTDVPTTTVRDAMASITQTSRSNALLLSENIDLNTYTDFGAKNFELLGQNMQQSLEMLPMAVAINDSLKASTVARASLDAGTAAHLITVATITKVEGMFDKFKVPYYYDSMGSSIICNIHSDVYADLLADTMIVAIGQYQDKSIILNKELGMLGRVRFVVSPDAHVWFGAGAANATQINTTTAAAIQALAKTFTITSASNLAVGMRLTIGTVESSTTLYPDTEQVMVTGIDSTTITIVGAGINGGFEYDHASGVSVINNDSAYATTFGGPESIAKMYAQEVGEFGQVIGPKTEGNADHIHTLAWKWYGGYGLLAGNRIIRLETASGVDK